MLNKKVFFLIIAIALVFAFDLFAEGKKITVQTVIGDVTYKRGEGKPRPIRKTTRLQERDVVRTLVESSVEIQIDDGSTITIEENSVVDLAQVFSENGDSKTKIHIKSGKILFNVKKLASKRSDFEFETPTATAAIRGTRGGIGSQGNKTFAYLETGKLELKLKSGGKSQYIEQLQVAIQNETGFNIASVKDPTQLNQFIEVFKKQGALPSQSSLDTLFNTLPQALDSLPDTLKTVLDSTLQKSKISTEKLDSLDTPNPKRDTTKLLPRDTLSVPPNLLDSNSLKSSKIFPEKVSNTPIPAFQVAIQNPKNGVTVNSSTITVTGIATPGSTVQSGAVKTKADSKGNWSLQLATPSIEGEFNLTFQFSLGSLEKNLELTLNRLLPKNGLRGSINGIPTQVEQARLKLTGTCNEGALVQVGVFNTQVRQGNWALDVSWPESDEGTVKFEVYCSLGADEILLGEVQTQYIRPIIPLTLNLYTPKTVLQKSAELVVAGSVTGSDVKVTVLGRSVPVFGGKFSVKIPFSQSNWDIEEIEVVAANDKDEISQNIRVSVDKTSPSINTNKPEFVRQPVLVNNELIRFGISDDVGDEVKLSLYIDGEEISQTSFQGVLNSKDLLFKAGTHDYRIEAVDLAGNRTVWLRNGIQFYPRVEWSIVMINPRVNQIRSLPPASPGAEAHTPTDDIRFRVSNLPNDDFKYIKEVRVTNQTNGAQKIWRDIEIDDIEFEFDDMPLSRTQPNVIVIRVEPHSGPVKTVNRVYDFR